MFFRFWIGALCLGALVHKKLRQINRRLLLCGALCGTLLFFSFFILTLGLEFTTPANSAFLSASSVMLVPFISWIMLKIRPERKVFIGCFLCLLGVAVLSLQLGSGIYFTMGDSLTLLSAVFFSFYTCTVAKVSGGLDASLFTFVQLLATAIWSTITLPISGADFSVIGQNWLSFGAVVFLGLFNTGLCYLIQMVAQKSLAANPCFTDPQFRVAVWSRIFRSRRIRSFFDPIGGRRRYHGGFRSSWSKPICLAPTAKNKLLHMLNNLTLKPFR